MERLRRADPAAHGLEHRLPARGLVAVRRARAGHPVLLRALLRARYARAGLLRESGALVTWATHGEPFVAAVENGPLAATQFHPEKSGDAGAVLLSNWLEKIR